MKLLFLFASVLFAEASASVCKISDANILLAKLKENHPAMGKLKFRNENSQAIVKDESQFLNPELSMGFLTGDTSEGKSKTYEIELTQTIELGGKRAKRADLMKSKVALENTQTQLTAEDSIVEAVNQMFEIKTIDKLIPIYEETLSSYRSVLKSKTALNSLSPEAVVEKETLELLISDVRLKLFKLEDKKKELEQHLSYYANSKCLIDLSKIEITADTSFLDESIEKQIAGNNEINIALQSKELVIRELALLKGQSIPNLKIGPAFEFEKTQGKTYTQVGVNVSFDLPVFSSNKFKKGYLDEEIKYLSKGHDQVRDEVLFDLETSVIRYKRLSKQLGTLKKENAYEAKHQKIEKLFSRGLISTSMIIEVHRQLIEYAETIASYEQEAVGTLWNIYKLQGTVLTKSI